MMPRLDTWVYKMERERKKARAPTAMPTCLLFAVVIAGIVEKALLEVGIGEILLRLLA